MLRPAHCCTGRRVILLFLALASALLAPRLAAQQPPSGYEPGLFEIRVPRFSSATVPVLVNSASGLVLVPVVQALDLVGIHATLASEGLGLSAPARSVEPELRIDVPGLTFRRGEAQGDIPPGQALVYEGELYLGAPSLGALLGAATEVIWADLVVTLTRETPFPAQAEESARRRRELAQILVGRAREPDAVPTVPYRSATGGAVVEWGISTTENPLRSTSVRSALGLAMLGGGLTLSSNVELWGQGVRSSYGTALYRRIFPTSSVIRTLDVGDVMAGSVIARTLRGVVIGNVDPLRTPSFGPAEIRPELPTGWEFEVYQGSQLVGFSSEGGGSVAIPLRYGANPIVVKMIGPAGQEVVQQALLQVPLVQLRPGRIEYSAGLGTCVDAECERLGFGSASIGLTRWLTVGGGADYLRSDSAEHVRPHLLASLSTLRGFDVELQVAPRSLSELRLRYFGLGPLAGSGRFGVSYPGAGQLSVLYPATRHWYGETTAALYLPAESRRLRSIRAEARVEGANESAPDAWRGSIFAAFQSFAQELRYERSPLRTGGLISVRSTAITPGSWPRLLRHTSVSAAAGVGEGELAYLEGGMSLRVLEEGAFQVTTRWDGRLKRSTLSVGLAKQLGFGRLQSRLVASPAATSAGVSVDGALAYGRSAGVVPVRMGGAGTSGLTGHVFYDLNRNGELDAGEEPADRVPVIAGPLLALTNDRGVYRVWGVPPYETATVTADTLRLADPSWTPLRSATTVRPVPNRFTRVDIPLVRTVELVGRLVAGKGVATAAGVTVNVVDEAAGVVHSVLTFSDGQFYISRLRPGRYRVQVAQSSLDALRATASPGEIRFTVANEDVLELQPIALAPIDPFGTAPRARP